MSSHEGRESEIFADTEWQHQLDREAYDAAVGSYAGRLASRDAIAEIYQRLNRAEDRIAPSADYLIGSAKIADEILVLYGLSRVLLTAEHATIHLRKDQPKEADMGTGGLAEVVAQDTNSTAVIAIGRQTSDAYSDPTHPLKDDMAEIISLPQNRAHFSLHMLDRGRASDPADKRGYSVMLGIGNRPSEATLALKDYLLEVGSDLDLRVGVNVPHINFNKNTHQLRRNEGGTIRTVTFAAAGPNSTRTFSQSLSEQLGKNDEYAAVQMEINEVLLVRQNDEVAFPSGADQQLGSYLGYLFVRLAAESVQRL